jgi:hypothetical protein
MPHRDSLFKKLVRIARANTACLQAYKADLWLHDQYVIQYLTAPGDEYVWILREHGTQLFRLYQGSEPVPVEFWLNPEYRHSRAYHVVCTDVGFGTVEAISHEHAIRLAHEPQRGALKLSPRERRLTEHLREVIACAGDVAHSKVRLALLFVDEIEFGRSS